MAPSEQWQEVNIAATKRYIGSLKRLSGKVSACSGGGCMAHQAGFATCLLDKHVSNQSRSLVVANLWSLGLQDSNKRKMTVRADGEVFPLTKEDLKTTELKRWPDFDFFIGGNEPGASCQSLMPDVRCLWSASQSTIISLHPIYGSSLKLSFVGHR